MFLSLRLLRGCFHERAQAPFGLLEIDPISPHKRSSSFGIRLFNRRPWWQPSRMARKLSGARKATCSTARLSVIIDLLAPKHGIDPAADAGFLRQMHEELECFIGDAIL